MSIDVIGYVNIVICITDILIGLLVLSSNSKKSVNLAYFLCTLSMGVWSLGLFFYDNPILLNSVQWLKIVYVISYLMTFAQLYFVITFNGGLGKKILTVIFTVLIPTFLYGLYVLLVTDSVVLGTYEDMVTGTTIAKMGDSYLYYFIPILISLIFLFAVHMIKGQQRKGLRRKQSIYYWTAGFFMIVPLVVLDFVLPILFENTAYYKFSTLGNILWTVIIAYSIYNTRFLDVRIVLGNLLNFLFRAIYIAVFLLLYIYIQNRYPEFMHDKSILVLILFSLVFAFVLNWLSLKTEKFIQRKYVYSKYNPINALQKYSGMNSKELDLKQIIKNTTQIVEETMKPRSVSILLFNSKSMDIVEQSTVNFDTLNKSAAENFMYNWENLNSNPILILSEIEENLTTGKVMIDERKNAIIDFMRQFSIEMVLPFEFKSDISGILMIGDKKDNSLYSTGDINFLDNVIGNANVAIGRAYLYTELQSFNQTLQSKVDAQTKELQVKVTELQEARKKENDMIDIMGHELRTPATIVKLNAQLLEKFTGDIHSDPEAYKRYVDRIKMAVENEIKLINTLLSSAKLEGDKIVIDPEEVNISDEVEMAIHGNERDAKEKNLPIINNMKSDTPHVYADKARVVEILNNLISNAVKYTDKGSITIEDRYDDNYVEISIIDTGNGISAEDLPKLGQKFYRAGNYIDSSESDKVGIVRPGGTGLGLFVTFNLIRKMGGDIRVESEVGKGSKFIFILPIYKTQAVHDHNGDSNNMFEKLGLKKQ